MKRRDLLVATLVMGGITSALAKERKVDSATKIVTSGGVELATKSFGTPEKGTILLAMGATASMVWWPIPMVKSLAEHGYQVIRFDHRDTGQSTTNAPGEVQYDVNDLADDLLNILNAHGVKGAHLVGMSLGAYVSQINALKHPERVLSLTMISAEPVGIAYSGEGISPPFMEHMAAMGELDWSESDAVTSFMLGIAQLAAGSARPFDQDAALARITLELERTDSIQSAFNHAMVGGQIDPSFTAAGLTQPLLLIHGSEDPIISVNAAGKTADAVPGSKLLVLEGVGHELVQQDVPRIVEAILGNCERWLQLN